MDSIPMRQMPRYQCHKKVWALKIAKLRVTEQGGWEMTPADDGYAAFILPDGFYERHGPQEGGYYVVYDGDGYKSYSPAKAFEDGYARI